MKIIRLIDKEIGIDISYNIPDDLIWITFDDNKIITTGGSVFLNVYIPHLILERIRKNNFFRYAIIDNPNYYLIESDTSSYYTFDSVSPYIRIPVNNNTYNVVLSNTSLRMKIIKSITGNVSSFKERFIKPTLNIREKLSILIDGMEIPTFLNSENNIRIENIVLTNKNELDDR